MTEPDKTDISKLFNQLGIKASSLGKVRMGRGVVGKTSHVAIAFFAVLAIIAYGTKNDWVLAGVGLIAAAVFVWLVDRLFRFSEKNPTLALMEGAELIAWQQIEMAAKGVTRLPPDNSIADPEGPLPVAAELTSEPDA